MPGFAEPSLEDLLHGYDALPARLVSSLDDRRRMPFRASQFGTLAKKAVPERRRDGAGTATGRPAGDSGLTAGTHARVPALVQTPEAAQ